LDWSNLATPAYSWYGNDSATYANLYGAIYNWFVVDSGNVCPKGWRMPSEGDWNIFSDFLNQNYYNYDSSSAGNKFAKALASTSGWISSPNFGVVGNTDYPEFRNKTGFTALPAGMRHYSGDFLNVRYGAYWWSSTPDTVITFRAIGYSISFDQNNFNQSLSGRKEGFSIRCIKE